MPCLSMRHARSKCFAHVVITCSLGGMLWPCHLPSAIPSPGTRWWRETLPRAGSHRMGNAGRGPGYAKPLVQDRLASGHLRGSRALTVGEATGGQGQVSLPLKCPAFSEVTLGWLSRPEPSCPFVAYILGHVAQQGGGGTACLWTVQSPLSRSLLIGQVALASGPRVS